MAEDFDPCECVYSHELAMQRLISLLRNSQAYCTTEECFTSPPGPIATQNDGGTDGTFMMFAMGWVLLALVLYFMRPTSLTQRGDAKPSRNNGPSQPPPDNSVQ